jgi:hypothetical protein
MTKFAVASDFVVRGPSVSSPLNRQRLNQYAFMMRMERLIPRRKENRTGAVRSASRHPDALLLVERKTLDDAWTVEVMAMIAAKRAKTPEADAALAAARSETAQVVRKIEMMRACTLDGLRVKARADLWHRNGEPLECDIANDEAAYHASVEMAETAYA